MKNQAIQYVAIDVHQATLVVSVRDEQGSVVMRATVATEAKAIVGVVRGLDSRVHVAFEEGTQAQWLHDLLTPHVERVVVCNTRGRREMTNKNDRLDADRLSELLRLGAFKPVYHGASGLLTLKELVRSYVNLVEDATRVMLRVKALFRGRGIRTPGTSVYRQSKRKEWLAQLEERGARARAEALLTELDVLQELRPKAKATMIAEARRQPGWKVLRSIPFLGPVRVAEIDQRLRRSKRWSRSKRTLEELDTNVGVARYQPWRRSLRTLEALAMNVGGARYERWRRSLRTLVALATNVGSARYERWRRSLRTLEALATNVGGARYERWRRSLRTLEGLATNVGGARYERWRRSLRTLVAVATNVGSGRYERW